MSVEASCWAWRQETLTPGELLVLLCLSDHADERGENCYPTQSRIAGKTHLTRTFVNRAIRSLARVGLLEISPYIAGEPFGILKRYKLNLKVCLKSTGLLTESTGGVNSLNTSLLTESTLNHQLEPSIRKESAKALSLSSPKSKRKLTRAAGIPPELQPTVSRVVAKINELGGTHYRDDKPETLRNLLACLREGRTEAECLAVVEGRHAAWAGNDKMLEYFRPSTLFAQAHFEDYLQDAQRRGNGNGHAKPIQVKDLGNGMVEVDGVQMDRRIYERRHGQHAN
jgi:uncharacterized phage protein (TIGR02220 family)